jgi:Regulator of chromosome condensation (RCC1) repeat
MRRVVRLGILLLVEAAVSPILLAGDVFASGGCVIHPQAHEWRYLDFDVAAEGGVVVRLDGRAFIWGQFSATWPSPVWAGLDFSELEHALSVSIGFGHAALLRPDGSAYCWGTNTSGECDPPNELGPFAKIVAGRFGTLALTQSGQAVAWGSVPEMPGLPTKCVDIALGIGSVAVIGADGVAYMERSRIRVASRRSRSG